MHTDSHMLRSLVVLVGVLCAPGCTPEIHHYMRFPDLFNPGWAKEQRDAAIRHDPYPLNDVGPEIVGGRPREYQQPVTEVERGRMGAPRPAVYQPIPIPILPGSPPAVVMPPPVVTTPPVVTAPYSAAPPSAQPLPIQPRNPY